MTAPDSCHNPATAGVSSTGFFPSDAELARAAVTDSRAFENLVARYYPLIFSIARARLRNVEAAEDLAQEVVLRLFLKLGDLRDHAAFPRWTRQITRNLASKWEAGARMQSRLLPLIPLEELPEDLHPSACPDPRAVAGGRQEKALLEDALERLPVPLAEVVLLHYAEGLSKSEVARLLGVHPSTVSRQLDAALLRLRDVLHPIVREAAAPLSSSSSSSHGVRQGAKRAALLAAAVAAMSGETKAALARAVVAGAPSVSGSLPAAAGGLAGFVSSTFLTGGILVAKGKAVVLAGVVVGVLATATFQYPRVAKFVATPGLGGGSSAEVQQLRLEFARLKTELGAELFSKPVNFTGRHGEPLGPAYERLGQEAGVRIVYKGIRSTEVGGYAYNGPFGGALHGLMKTHDQKAVKMPDGSIEIHPR